mgnify:CR=1 FL=1
MPVLRTFTTTALACAALCATATAASLPVNQRFADSKGKVSLLTRSGGKGYVNARTRCGRLADGVCIRLYAEEDFEARPDFTDPEILRTNLASVIWRMTEASEVRWISGSVNSGRPS